MKPIIIEPTVGRSVHYYPRHFDPGEQDVGGPQAAVIARVIDNRMVNLTVSDSGGKPYALKNVVLAQESDTHPTEGYCCWSPHDLEQTRLLETLQMLIDSGHVASSIPARYENKGGGDWDRRPIKPAPSNE